MVSMQERGSQKQKKTDASVEGNQRRDLDYRYTILRSHPSECMYTGVCTYLSLYKDAVQHYLNNFIAIN